MWEHIFASCRYKRLFASMLFMKIIYLKRLREEAVSGEARELRWAVTKLLTMSWFHG